LKEGSERMGEETQKTELEKLGFELVERNSDDCKKVVEEVMEVFEKYHVGYKEMNYFLELIRELMELSFSL
jgi:hypothetical protein